MYSSREGTTEQEPDIEQSPPRVSGITGLVVGLSASVIMTVFLVALRFVLDTPVFHEVLADWLTRVMPAVVFDFMLERLQASAKPLLFVSLLLGQLAAGSGLGFLYARYSSKLPFSERDRYKRGFLIAAPLWLGVMVVVTPAIGGGLFGASLPDGPRGYMLTTFLIFIAYGISLTQFHYLYLTRSDVGYDIGRREFIHRAAFFILLAAAGGFAIRTILRNVSNITPSRIFRESGELPPEVTPNDHFYQVSKNIVKTRVDVSKWKLTLDGEVGNPFSLTYEELVALPWQEKYVTLTCISNPIGGALISNALWRGVPLKALLERAQLPASTRRLSFTAADGYVDSFPLEYAMRDNVLVAYQMNGEALPDDHG
ncbi:MAG: molybdopterin-dependent oxidoreductase, partial [Dehalococcoidia bacterium]